MTDATAVLSTYALDLDVGALPVEVVDRTRLVLADTIGVLFAASQHHAVRTALEVLPLTDAEPATVVGHGRGQRPENAAFINGIGGHDIELDDSHAPSLTHPAAVVQPAGLAAAEIAEVSYGELLAGLIAGYDVQARVSQAIGTGALHHRGFHPSSVVGSIGAAVGAGRILGLTHEEMRSAIGLAASQSSGLVTYYDDPYHMSKSFQTGIAARNGVTAALFARQGFGASPDVLTGDHDMIHPFGGEHADASKLTLELGERYEIARTSLKRHACCNQTHAAVDALLDLMAEHDIGVDDIRAIDVQVSTDALPGIDHNRLWTHNIQYVLALTAYERFIGPEHFTPAFTGRSDITDLASRVTARGSDHLNARFPAKKGAIVAITTGEGTFEREAEAPRGSPVLPLGESDLRDKFRHLAGTVLDEDTAVALWQTLLTSPLEARTAPLYEILGTSRRLEAAAKS